MQVLILHSNFYSEIGAKVLAEKLKKLSRLHTLEFNLKLGAISAEVLSLLQQQKVKKTSVILPQQTFSIIEIVAAVIQQSHQYSYYSIILGIAVLVGVLKFLFIKSSKKITPEGKSS